MTRRRGFTLIELAIVLAILAIVAALAASSLSRQRPRAQLMGTTAEVTALFRSARQNAMTTGNDTVVMVFPQAANPSGGVGMVMVYVDQAHTFFDATQPVHFGTFDPAHPTIAGGDGLLGQVDFPRGISVGLGGKTAPTLVAPYANLGTVSACSFCGGDRGAVVFDYHGRASFHSGDGNALTAFGGTLALQGRTGDLEGYRMLVITPATGGVRVFNNG